jgi:hypothetical protein
LLDLPKLIDKLRYIKDKKLRTADQFAKYLGHFKYSDFLDVLRTSGLYYIPIPIEVMPGMSVGLGGILDLVFGK